MSKNTQHVLEAEDLRKDMGEITIPNETSMFSWLREALRLAKILTILNKKLQ